jgi:hypothetical protein
MSIANTYATGDLFLCAFLRAMGHNLKAIREDRQRSIFVFPDSADLRADILRYTNDDPVALRARNFMNLLRDLRGLARGATA